MVRDNGVEVVAENFECDLTRQHLSQQFSGSVVESFNPSSLNEFEHNGANLAIRTRSFCVDLVQVVRIPMVTSSIIRVGVLGVN
jgi:hypothetical protein